MVSSSIEWEGFVLGDETEAGHDLTILGREGVKGLGTAPRDTTLTPNANGGDTRGSSVSRSRIIAVDGIYSKAPGRVMAFLGKMAAVAPDDERPLIFRGFLWGDPGDEGTPAVQLWAGPDRSDPVLDAEALGAGNYRLGATSWTASDPTFFSATAITLDATTPALAQELVFNNIGNAASLSGRAWTASITAGTGGASNPYIDLGDQRVTWAGVTLPPSSTMIIDRHRHSYIGTFCLDHYRTSNSAPNPDWPVHGPGANTFTIGCSSGTVTAQLVARSTWLS